MTTSGVNIDEVLGIVERQNGRLGGVLAVLQEVQARFGYLPPDALRAIAAGTGRALVDVYAVATFYKGFRLAPKGRRTISVCQGTACHVRGSEDVVCAFERGLGIARGETTADGQITLETVNCLGACALGPIVVADGEYFSRVTPAEVGRIIEYARGGTKAPEPPRPREAVAAAAEAVAVK